MTVKHGYLIDKWEDYPAEFRKQINHLDYLFPELLSQIDTYLELMKSRKTTRMVRDINDVLWHHIKILEKEKEKDTE